MSFGESAWRERQAEWAALLTIQGASGRDVLKNNDLPEGWEVTDKEGKKSYIPADYTMRRLTITNCAKDIKIDFDALCDLTGEDAEKLYEYYPQWLYEKSPKKKLFRLMDDKQIDSLRQVTEVGVKRQIMFNKFDVQLRTRKQMFVAGNPLFVLVCKIRIENAVMSAAARGSNAAITQRLTPLIDLCRDETVPDAEARTHVLEKLLESKEHLRDELPAVFKEELNNWVKAFLYQHVDEQRRMFMSDDDEGGSDE